MTVREEFAWPYSTSGMAVAKLVEIECTYLDDSLSGEDLPTRRFLTLLIQT